MSVLLSVLLTLQRWAHSRKALQLEIPALRHQLQVLQRTRPGRLRLSSMDRCLWAMVSRIWTGLRTSLVIVKAKTVIAWHRRGFRLWWTWKSRRRIGRPTDRPRRRPGADSDDGAGEPALGRAADSRRTAETGGRRLSGDRCEIHGASASASLTDLANILKESHRPDRGGRFLCGAEGDLPPSVRAGASRARSTTHHARRSHRASDGGVDGPAAPRSLSVGRHASISDHDRDHAFDGLGATAKAMGIEEVLTAPHPPWQNAFVERFIGSARRECLDHVIVFNEAGLQRLMTLCCSCHERSRTHLSLNKDAPVPRPVTPPRDGTVVAIPQVGRLHQGYDRRAG